MEEYAYRALVVSERDNDTFSMEILEQRVADLPPGDLLIKVHFSSLNYKDALSASGNRGVTRNYPHVPGIDAAGVVAKSSSSRFKEGNRVIVSGFDLGMNTPGGFGQFIRVPAAWVVRCPQELDLRESMIYGTAGFTAAQSVKKLMDFAVKPGAGKILVTGASGGVGSVAVSLLKHLGYSVSAASGKPEAADFLTELGAAEIITRQQATDSTGKFLLKEKWAGVIDTVGGTMLSSAIKSTRYGGVVTCCGNVASPELSLSVYPFILRGISLLGIDSAKCPIDVRETIWQKLARDWRINLERLVNECSLPELPAYIGRMLRGQHQGRLIVNLHQ